MEWKAHLKSSSLESESRLDALNFFLPGCYENLTVTWDFKNQRKCENLHQDVLNETIDYKWTTTLTLDTWTYTVKQKLFSPNKMDFLDFFIHSFLFHDIGLAEEKIGHFHAVVFFSSLSIFLVSLRTLQSLHAIDTIFSWVPRNVGSLQRRLDYLRRFT